MGKNSVTKRHSLGLALRFRERGFIPDTKKNLILTLNGQFSRFGLGHSDPGLGVEDLPVQVAQVH
jgi:hypothetical protein